MPKLKFHFGGVCFEVVGKEFGSLGANEEIRAKSVNFFTEHSGASIGVTTFKDADLWLSKTEITMRKCLIALSETFLQQLQFLQTESILTSKYDISG